MTDAKSLPTRAASPRNRDRSEPVTRWYSIGVPMLAGAAMPASIPASSDRVRFEMTVFIRTDITQFARHQPDPRQKTLLLLLSRPRVFPWFYRC